MDFHHVKDSGGGGGGGAITSPIGQQVMAASVGVAIASDQSAIPVSLGSVGAAFMAVGSMNLAGLTDAALLSLYNPVGSGKEIYIDALISFLLNTGAAANINSLWLKRFIAAADYTGGTSALAPAKVDNGSAASIATGRIAASGALVNPAGLVLSNPLLTISTGTATYIQQTTTYKFSRPLKMSPGSGLVIASQSIPVAGAVIQPTIEWREV